MGLRMENWHSNFAALGVRDQGFGVMGFQGCGELFPQCCNQEKTTTTATGGPQEPVSARIVLYNGANRGKQHRTQELVLYRYWIIISSHACSN